MNAAGHTQSSYQDTTGFGSLVAGGGAATPFKFGGANGCQTDADTGLVLMGHRYYDTRTGRFLTQDPIGDGTNWYTYCDNNPVNLTDPLGLVCPQFDPGTMSQEQIYDHVTSNGGEVGEEYQETNANGKVINTFTVSGFSYGGMSIVGPYGQGIGRNINEAKNFMASAASKSPYHYGWHGGQTGSRPDVNKIAAWLIKHVNTGRGQDYKTKGQQYDAFGHVNYAAVATVLRFNIGAIILGQQFVHLEAHGLTSGLEGSGNEYLGQEYAQKFYNPGPALFDEGDAAHAFLNYKYGL